MSDRTTDPVSLPMDVKRKLLAARDALAVGDLMEAHHQIYSIASPNFDKLADEVWTALETPTPALSGGASEPPTNSVSVSSLLVGGAPEPSAEPVHDVISDSVNLANAKRRAHEWKLHIAARKGHMPFEEVGAYLLDEIIRLENLVFAQQKNLDLGSVSPEPAGGQWQSIDTRPQSLESAYLVTNGKQVAPWIRGVIHNAPGTACDWEYGSYIIGWMPFPAPSYVPTKDEKHD